MLGMSEDTRSHDKLKLPESQVTETVMPVKEFFLGFRKVDIGIAYNGNS